MADPRFPTAFVKSAEFRWEAEAPEILKGFLSSLSDGLKPHEAAGAKYLGDLTGSGAFIQETSLLKHIYGGDGGSMKPVCDFVSKSKNSQSLTFLESKSKLDSAALKNPTIAEKFEATISQFFQFYREAKQPQPGVTDLILTCTKVNISGSSRWGVADGLLTFETKAVVVKGTGLNIKVVELG